MTGRFNGFRIGWVAGYDSFDEARLAPLTTLDRKPYLLDVAELFAQELIRLETQRERI